MSADVDEHDRLTRRELVGALAALAGGAAARGMATPSSWLENGAFQWNCSPPLIEPERERADPCHAIKDPTVVFFDGCWHVFATIRSTKRTHQIEYLSFRDWPEANQAKRHVLTLNPGYFCAPQVFWFSPHRKWYLVHQASDPSRKVTLQPAFSTTEAIDDPLSWSKPDFLFDKHPENVERWIDFCVIADDARAYLFFTSLDGKMWRAETKLADFPHGWSRPAVVLDGDIFEASHTYRIKDVDRFLTIVEAQGPGGRRYYKAYLADKLDGTWKPLAATLEKPLAAPKNVRPEKEHWTDSFSHGELLRTGRDERMEIEPARLQFLFQGVLDADRRGKQYGDIPWKLGILRFSS